jgi:hypothetical protein
MFRHFEMSEQLYGNNPGNLLFSSGFDTMFRHLEISEWLLWRCRVPAKFFGILI